MANADNTLYKSLVVAAVIGTVAWLGWGVYDGLVANKSPGDFAYFAATNHFADGYFERALTEYENALRENPEHTPALRGRAETLILLQRESQAIEIYDQLIAQQPDVAAYYANRGIAFDRLGQHEKALQDYDAALGVDTEIGEGPGWLTRFLRNQADQPPGITSRADYLREQLALPEDQRVLRNAELDAEQRPYKK